MMVIHRILAITILILHPLFVSAEELPYCVTLTAPVTSVADFDANGVVNGKDIAILAKHIGKKRRSSSYRSRHHRNDERSHSHRSKRHHRKHNIIYSPLFDRNADGEINSIDVFLATRDMGKTSSQNDQKLATISNEILAGTYSCVSAPVEPIPVEPIPVEPAPAEEIIIWL